MWPALCSAGERESPAVTSDPTEEVGCDISWWPLRLQRWCSQRACARAVRQLVEPQPAEQAQQPEEKKDAKTPDQKKKEEGAFKDAVGRIPDGKFDPWGKVRR